MFGGAYGDARMPNWPHWHRTTWPVIATTGLRHDEGDIYKKLRYRSQFWSDFDEIRMVGAGPLMGEPYGFWKQLAQ